MEANDVFLVFVEGSEGNHDAYARWFAGDHMGDMVRLPGVLSANAYRLESLDGDAVPAQLCAIYEIEEAAGILATIAKAKGTKSLPLSPIQGKMTWRVLEGVDARDLAGAGHAPFELIGMFAGAFDVQADARLLQWLCDNPQGIGAIRQTRLAPVQPPRGNEFGSIAFVRTRTEADARRLATSVAGVRGALAGSRFLLASSVA